MDMARNGITSKSSTKGQLKNMFYLIYEGRPHKDHKDKSIAGGMIGCWIETTTMYKANKVARQLIEEQNWKIIRKDRFKTVKRNSIDKESDHYQYYEQALIDKEVLVFYTYTRKNKLKQLAKRK